MSATVQYYYQSTVTNTSGSTVFSSVLDALVGAITGTAAVNSGAKGITATTGIRSGLNTGTPFSELISPDITSPTGDKPKAYLNIVFFDSLSRPVGREALQFCKQWQHQSTCSSTRRRAVTHHPADNCS